jgi:radical SAM superfamily enzyme YgiQ (UPF0313 family)
MMICLVTAPTITEFTTPEELSSGSVESAATEPQLGVLSLAAVLQDRGDDLRIVNLNRTYYEHSRLTLDAISDDFAQVAARQIGSQYAEVYGFSSICSSYPLTLRIARAVKALQPASAILLGGPQASVVDVQTVAAFPFVDFVLRGEAERSLPALIEQLHGEKQFDQVGGLTYRVGNEPRRNLSAKPIENLDELPAPAYQITGELKGATKAALELGRGCPYACTFCSTNDFFRRNFRLRSPQRLLQDMRSIADEYGIRNFELVHDMFTVDRRRVVAFCESMIISGEDFTWSCSARTDCVDKELLEMMARAGCRGIFYGVEVGSARMQRIIEKDLDLQWAKKVIDDTEGLGIRSTVSLITGFPEETWDDLWQTVRIYMHSARCPNSSPQLNILAPLAETPIHSEHRQTLILDKLCSDMSHQGCKQNEADLWLIREYPDIFPNFYLLSLQYLDRQCLLELREFMLNALARFRWLIVAIDQNANGIGNLFREWRKYRFILRPGQQGFDLRRYYRTSEFCADFQSFIRQHSVAKHTVVKILLDFEDAMRNSILADQSVKPFGSLVAPGCELWWNDIPVKKAATTMIEFPHDIQMLIQEFRLKSGLPSSHARQFYLRREVSPGIDKIEQISDWLACVLRNCDGRHNIGEVVEQLDRDITELEESVREYAFVRLLAGAHAEGFIEIYRPSPDECRGQASPSSPSLPSMPN